MRLRRCIPMIALCALLTACGTEEETRNIRKPYQEGQSARMTARLSWDWEGLFWEGTLQCTYVPGEGSTVEVLAPEVIAGVTVTVGEDWTLSYEGDILPVAPLTNEGLTPAACLPMLMEALSEGWLLEENREDWGEEPCYRLVVDQSGETGKLFSTVYLKEADGLPLYAELAVEEETVFKVEFTEFTFCGTIESLNKHERSEG